MVGTNQNKVGRTVHSDWSQPRKSGSLHCALSLEKNGVRSNEMNDMNAF